MPPPNQSFPSSQDAPDQRAAFAPTHWSVVLAAGHRSSPDAAAALEQLCQRYWPPLYAYVRRRGHDEQNAKDLTQEFFARLIESNQVASAEPSRGKFRTFLLTSLNHFLVNEWHRAHAAKRGGNAPLISLDAPSGEERYRMEPATDLTPEKLYDKHWALAVMDQALRRLRAQYGATGQAALFSALEPCLTGATDADYATAGAPLGMTAGAVAVAVHRLRQRYRQSVRDEVAQTVADAAALEDEMRCLFAALNCS